MQILFFKHGRMQNSPYFCVFKCAQAVEQKVWNDAENRGRDWGETLKIRYFLLPHTPVRLLRHALPTVLHNTTVVCNC